MSNGDWTFIVFVVMVIGWAGTIVPIIPGLILMWAAALVYGFATGFGPEGIVVMVILTTLVILGVIKSAIVPKRSAEAHGASRASQLGALVGAVIGFFVIPVIGLFVGAMVGIFVIEQMAKRNVSLAWRASKGVAIGFVKSAALDIAIGFVMISVWSAWAARTLL